MDHGPYHSCSDSGSSGWPQPDRKTAKRWTAWPRCVLQSLTDTIWGDEPSGPRDVFQLVVRGGSFIPRNGYERVSLRINHYRLIVGDLILINNIYIYTHIYIHTYIYIYIYIRVCIYVFSSDPLFIWKWDPLLDGPTGGCFQYEWGTDFFHVSVWNFSGFRLWMTGIPLDYLDMFENWLLYDSSWFIMIHHDSSWFIMIHHHFETHPIVFMIFHSLLTILCTKNMGADAQQRCRQGWRASDVRSSSFIQSESDMTRGTLGETSTKDNERSKKSGWWWLEHEFSWLIYG